MKIFPPTVDAEKNKKTGIAPVWIFQITVGNVNYFLSDSIFTVPGFTPPLGSKWPANTLVTTLPWVKTWGQIAEGISSSINEFKISDYQLTCVADRSASPNIYELATEHELEESTCSLYKSYIGANIPQEMFRGYIKDSPCPSDFEVTLIAQDESYKLQNYVGNKITTALYPDADPDDVGKVIPLPFGSLKKFPALALDAGKQTSLPASITALAGSVLVSDATGLINGMAIQVDDEQMLITGVAGDYLSVTRGVNGTLAGSHQRGAAVWEQKVEFIYVASDFPVTSILKVYCQVGNILLDISMLCTVWPSGNHPSYPGKAVISVPGYVTVEQAISLAIADGISVTDTKGVVLSGNVTRQGGVTLAGNVTKTGGASLAGAITRSGGVSLSGLVSLTGSLLDPGHSHNAALSNSEATTSQLPSPVATYVSGLYGLSFNHHVAMNFPSDGARSSVSYNITVNPAVTGNGLHVYAFVNGTAYYSNMYNWLSGSPFSFSFTVPGDIRVDTVDIVVDQNWDFYVTAISRTIQLSNNQTTSVGAGVTTGTLAGSNGTLNTADTLVVGNGTLGVSDTTAVNNGTLGAIDTLVVDNGTLSAGLNGTILKAGTVTLAGNSVANTLVGDKILCDVVSPHTLPGDVFSFIGSNYCNGNVHSITVVGAFPVGYAFNGAITEYKRAMEWFTLLALQSRSYFRMHLGTGKLIVRPDVLTSVKNITSCALRSDGSRDISRNKTLTADLINKINLNYLRDWGGDTAKAPYKGLISIKNDASIATYGEFEKPNLFDCDFITDPVMAASVANFYLANYGTKKWINTFAEFLDMSELEFADGVQQTFLDGKIGEIQEVRFSPGDSTKMDSISIVTRG